ncbi:MAG: LTA synthase family protein [Gammaproteobacteria bacterium]|nr:MAG: LTA synthase family protein [Gammaproteobacteria bacterium]
MIKLITFYSFSLLFSFLLERFAVPRPVFLKRSPYAWLIHIASITILFVLAYLIFARAFFASMLTLTILVLILAVNNAKFRALREPLVFSDFVLYMQVFKHPRFYLPFLSIIHVIAFAAMAIITIYIGLSVENAAYNHFHLSVSDLLWPAVLLTAALIILVTGLKGIRIEIDPIDDVKNHGLYATLVAHALLSFRQTALDQSVLDKYKHFQIEAGNPVKHESGRLQDIIVIQSESYFDARLLEPKIKNELFLHYDRIRSQSLQHGRLNVPTWGANTMRAEFAFLTGIPIHELGLQQFNPYQSITRQKIPSIAHYLKTIGYRCICIHPYHADFFKRHIAIPNFGFDEFIDIESFEDVELTNPYIDDLTLADRILQIQQASSEPLFIFAITMENHGPLHLETITTDDEKQVYTQQPPDTYHDLTVYLRHIINADRMIDRLTTELAERQSSTLLCFFGDHVPSMPDVYRTRDYHDPKTNYFLWSPAQQHGKEVDMDVTDLGVEIIKAAGIS